jgi:hypothetical protein
MMPRYARPATASIGEERHQVIVELALLGSVETVRRTGVHLQRRVGSSVTVFSAAGWMGTIWSSSP